MQRIILSCALVIGCHEPVAVTNPCDIDYVGQGTCKDMGADMSLLDASAEPLIRYGGLVIIDSSSEQSQENGAGVDICGVFADCGGEVLIGIGALALETGTGDVMASETDFDSLFDDGAECAEIGDYLSLGMGGSVKVIFGQDLQGCTVRVVELLATNDYETYSIYLCAEYDDQDCIDGGAPLAESLGGIVEVEIPPAF